MCGQKDFKSQRTGQDVNTHTKLFYSFHRGYKFKLRHSWLHTDPLLLNCFQTPTTDTENISYMSLPAPLPEDSSCIDHSQLQEVKFLSVMPDELIESYMSTYIYVIYMSYINENKFYLNG